MQHRNGGDTLSSETCDEHNLVTLIYNLSVPVVLSSVSLFLTKGPYILFTESIVDDLFIISVSDNYPYRLGQ